MRARWVLLLVLFTDCGGNGAGITFDINAATDAQLFETKDAAADPAIDSMPTVDSADILEVDAPCVPNCEGMECGSDGCGGVCGVCDELGGWLCEDGKCTCTPECPPLCCGMANGCGSVCECPSSEYSCINGDCIIEDICGNDICEIDEDPCSCPKDCLWGNGKQDDPCCSPYDCDALLFVPC